MPTDRSPAPTMIVVLAPGHDPRDSRPVLELRGRLDADLFRAAVDRIAADHPAPSAGRLRLHRHGPDHHSVELPPATGDPAAGDPEPYPAGLLADLITGTRATEHGPVPAPDGGPAHARGPLPRTFPVTPLQRELLADAGAGPDHQVEQLVWRWYGPLDTGLFSTAWGSVADCETVLRSAFVWDPHPRTVLFDRCGFEVAHHAHGTFPDREHLLTAERRRGFDLRRPGPLRVALLDGPPVRSAADEPSTDVVLTYHRALLDGWSVRLLIREFYRAYLSGGVLPGGERRPDLRDYTRWLDGRDTAPARDFWRHTAPVTALLPRAEPGERTGYDGAGRSRTRLSRAESMRLVHWAARWGVTESNVLHAVWAMLLYRATGPLRGPARIGFGVSFSGRGCLMEDVERIPGPLANPLPLSVEVDPADTVVRLLRTLRDQVLEMAAHEWTPAGRVREWTGRGPEGDAETLLAFERTPRRDDRLARALAARGVRVEQPVPAVARTASALGVVAHHDGQGGLVLSAVHDRERLADDRTRAMLVQSTGLLRRLPSSVREGTTVAEVIGPLSAAELPRVHERHGPGSRLVRLRAAALPGRAAVCLVAAPGAPDTWYGDLVRCYEGPEALFALGVPVDAARDGAAAVGRVAGPADRLVLGGFSGAGAVAYEIARHLAAAGRVPPLVVLGSDEEAYGARELARALTRAAG
ncbi:condensation domain-containing protein [Streptomyces sp. NPDC050504]|uniref:condensation domain-containing protein n=1 Tax=Streptomyces sp. NPDC050504 TaxID=3365618 RepID=UPI00378F34B2